MANLPARGMKSMGMHMGFDGHDASKLEEALQVVDTRKFGRMLDIRY